LNEAHARHVLAAYERHYNEHRPHRARNQLPPGADQQPITVHDLEVQAVHARYPEDRLDVGEEGLGLFRRPETVELIDADEDLPPVVAFFLADPREQVPEPGDQFGVGQRAR
jgi:hypothetical protein